MKNPNGKESGVTGLTVNGIKMEGNYIAAADLADTNEIEVWM